MIGEINVAGWEVLHGGKWPIHEELEPAVVSATEARRFAHFDGSERSWTDMWILDYHFNPGIRYRAESSGWKRRKPGAWHLLPPDVVFRQDTRASELPLHALWIRFHGGEKLGLRKLVDCPMRMASFSDPQGWLLQKVSSFALLRDTHGDDSYMEVAVGLMEIIRRLLTSQCETPGVYTLEEGGGSRLRDPLVEKIDAYLVAHLHESVTLEKMAADLHTSASTLKRRYTAASNRSIKQALTHLRISRAKRLLLEGATIAEAADKTGFFDPFHLSRTFKQMEGVPPHRFIMHMRQVAGGQARK